MAEQYALLVGVKTYYPTELTSLKYTENDVTAISETLLKKGYKKNNVVLMTQTTGVSNPILLPTSRNIRRQFSLLLAGLSPRDTVLIALTGHGVQFEGQGQHYFCPMDAEVADRSTLVSLSEILDTLSNCRAAGKVLLVDACRDDPLANVAKSGARISLEPISNRPPPVVEGGTAAFFSCAESQQSFEDPDLEHGVFFYFVNKALAGEAGDDRNGGSVSCDDLVSYARSETASHVRVKFRKEQNPSSRNLKDLQEIVLVKGVGPVGIVNSVGIRLKLIPPGKFVMGSNPTAKGAKSDEAWHDVEITKSFYLGATEITQQEWFSVMKTKPWEESADENFPMYTSFHRNPASYISWEDANEFCRRLSEIENRVYRLPTEAEWEYACRAQKGRRCKYNFGNDESLLREHAWFKDIDSERSVDKSPQEVAQKTSNGFGLFDMHGNVYEWCGDWMDKKYYSKSSIKDPKGPDSGKRRVLRGGACTMSSKDCRSAARFSAKPTSAWAEFGFRIVLELESDEK